MKVQISYVVIWMLVSTYSHKSFTICAYFVILIHPYTIHWDQISHLIIEHAYVITFNRMPVSYLTFSGLVTSLDVHPCANVMALF